MSTHEAKLKELRGKRAAAFDKFKALGDKPDFKKDDQPEFDKLKGEVEELDIQIKNAQAVQDAAGRSAQPVEGQERATVAATVEDDPWTVKEHAEARGLVSNKGLILGGCAKMIGAGNGSFTDAIAIAKAVYGENHPVTKALVAGVGASGGFIIPPQYIAEIIEILRPSAVVRSSNPRILPMPRGTMTLPAQTAAASATYGNEVGQIASSQQAVGQIVATYKKLKALVPVSNDLLRYADPAADALVRDDLVKVTALREDLAFLTGDGTQDSPRGYLSFANAFAIQVGTGTRATPVAGTGVAGVWSSTANSTAAVGGNFVTSTLNYTLATVASELGGLVNKLDTANVPEGRRVWFMHPRSYNYLNNVQNSLGVYVYRDELSRGTLLGYPVKKSTQLPINIWDTTGTNKDCSFVILAEMTESMIFDAMTLELAVSREGVYYDTNGALQSAFQQDLTIIRGIMEHDFQLRHTEAVAVNQLVRWAPAIS